jgi:hypothetical protein
MSNIFLAEPKNASVTRVDFSALVSLIHGTSIVSLADFKDAIELGLSENLNVRVQGTDGHPINVTIFSTLNEGEAPPVRLQLASEKEVPEAALIERRLRSIRQVYAMLVMLAAGRGKELSEYLEKGPSFDFEELLQPDERLKIRAAGPGSFWISVVTMAKKVAAAPQFALDTLTLVYGEGRQLLLLRARAKTAKTWAEAALAEQTAEALKDKRLIELSKAIDDTTDLKARNLLRQRLDSEMKAANPHLTGPAVQPLLPAPGHKEG